MMSVDFFVRLVRGGGNGRELLNDTWLNKVITLTSPPRLLIFRYFSHPPSLIGPPPFINFSSPIMNHRPKQKS